MSTCLPCYGQHSCRTGEVCQEQTGGSNPGKILSSTAWCAVGAQCNCVKPSSLLNDSNSGVCAADGASSIVCSTGCTGNIPGWAPHYHPLGYDVILLKSYDPNLESSLPSTPSTCLALCRATAPWNKIQTATGPACIHRCDGCFLSSGMKFVNEHRADGNTGWGPWNATVGAGCPSYGILAGGFKSCRHPVGPVRCVDVAGRGGGASYSDLRSCGIWTSQGGGWVASAHLCGEGSVTMRLGLPTAYATNPTAYATTAFHQACTAQQRSANFIFPMAPYTTGVMNPMFTGTHHARRRQGILFDHDEQFSGFDRKADFFETARGCGNLSPRHTTQWSEAVQLNSDGAYRRRRSNTYRIVEPAKTGYYKYRGCYQHRQFTSQCASQGSTCACTGLVRYGVGGTHGRWFYRHANGSIPCTDTAFGGNPTGDSTLKKCQCSPISKGWAVTGQEHVLQTPENDACYDATKGACGANNGVTGYCSACGSQGMCCRKTDADYPKAAADSGNIAAISSFQNGCTGTNGGSGVWNCALPDTTAIPTAAVTESMQTVTSCQEMCTRKGYKYAALMKSHFGDFQATTSWGICSCGNELKYDDVAGSAYRRSDQFRCPINTFPYHFGSHCCNVDDDKSTTGAPIMYTYGNCRDNNLISCPGGATDGNCADVPAKVSDSFCAASYGWKKRPGMACSGFADSADQRETYNLAQAQAVCASSSNCHCVTCLNDNESTCSPRVATNTTLSPNDAAYFPATTPTYIANTGTTVERTQLYECSDAPVSMNGVSHPTGCAGAVYSNGAGAYRYCSGNDGQYPWYAACCIWDQSNSTCKPRAGRDVISNVYTGGYGYDAVYEYREASTSALFVR